MSLSNYYLVTWIALALFTNYSKMLVNCTKYGISVISLSIFWTFWGLLFGDVNNLMLLGTLVIKYEKLGGEVK